ncbi:hypothetical protein TWF696_004932 [Orbilia brochopaga]|uniref:F-box domain-containing protein n=1 Tax=Orbilia brochopaga TaxID=3140254 RepID=A0AAV9V1Y6_9PEZI
MDKLPPEMIEAIVASDVLSAKDRAAFSQTSKWHRDIAKPIIYRKMDVCYPYNKFPGLFFTYQDALWYHRRDMEAFLPNEHYVRELRITLDPEYQMMFAQQSCNYLGWLSLEVIRAFPLVTKIELVNTGHVEGRCFLAALSCILARKPALRELRVVCSYVNKWANSPWQRLAEEDARTEDVVAKIRTLDIEIDSLVVQSWHGRAESSYCALRQLMEVFRGATDHVESFRLSACARGYSGIPFLYENDKFLVESTKNRGNVAPLPYWKLPKATEIELDYGGVLGNPIVSVDTSSFENVRIFRCWRQFEDDESFDAEKAAQHLRVFPNLEQLVISEDRGKKLFKDLSRGPDFEQEFRDFEGIYAKRSHVLAERCQRLALISWDCRLLDIWKIRFAVERDHDSRPRLERVRTWDLEMWQVMEIAAEPDYEWDFGGRSDS